MYYSLEVTNYGVREKKVFFVYMATSANRVVSKEAEKRTFRHNGSFRHMYV